MSAQPSERELSACSGKHSYQDRAEAMRMLRRSGRVVLHGYRCPHCGGWHVAQLLKRRRNDRSRRK